MLALVGCRTCKACSNRSAILGARCGSCGFDIVCGATQLMSDPDMMREMMNSPIMQQLMNNPEMMRGLIQNRYLRTHLGVRYLVLTQRAVPVPRCRRSLSRIRRSGTLSTTLRC